MLERHVTASAPVDAFLPSRERSGFPADPSYPCPEVDNRPGAVLTNRRHRRTSRRTRLVSRPRRPQEHKQIVHSPSASDPVARTLILASASRTRAAAAARAPGLPVTPRPARVDEEPIRAALEAEGASPRDIADALAEMKARKVAEQEPRGAGARLRSGAGVRRARPAASRKRPMQPGHSCAAFAARPTRFIPPSCSMIRPSRSGAMSARRG